MVAADVVSMTGDVAIDAITCMETVSKVSGATMRCFEGMSTPEDLANVLTLIQTHEGKATASLLRELSAKVQTDRWWQWNLTHPDLGPEKIHPTRSMYPC